MEIELKLAVPTPDPSGLAQTLARLPLLKRHPPVQQPLHNIYFDTPAQDLHQQRVALRLRRVGQASGGPWLQTLKIGGNSDSALSQRGEWETPVPTATLDAQALHDTPWSTLDPQATLFATLSPCFTTDFVRTAWTVPQRDGSVVEVALDSGHITAGAARAPLCELELELKAGDPAALFDLAERITKAVATVPLGISKAERGYALARNALHAPTKAHPPTLASDMAMTEAGQRVLREAFAQFTANLNGTLHADDPELVHQARVGWRRFKTGLKLFGASTDTGPLPSLEALRPLLTALGTLRDLEVASLETLPMLARAYTDGKRVRQAHWRAMEQALAHAADLLRDALHQTLCAPSTGTALLAITRWLEIDRAALASTAHGDSHHALKHHARDLVVRWHDQLETAVTEAQDAQSADSAHRARILAKRLRYGIEAVRPLLPKRRMQDWYLQASHLQDDLGSARDVQQALTIATRLKVDPGVLDFLRGVAAGKKHRQ